MRWCSTGLGFLGCMREQRLTDYRRHQPGTIGWTAASDMLVHSLFDGGQKLVIPARGRVNAEQALAHHVRLTNT